MIVLGCSNIQALTIFFKILRGKISAVYDGQIAGFFPSQIGGCKICQCRFFLMVLQSLLILHPRDWGPTKCLRCGRSTAWTNSRMPKASHTWVSSRRCAICFYRHFNCLCRCFLLVVSSTAKMTLPGTNPMTSGNAWSLAIPLNFNPPPQYNTTPGVIFGGNGPQGGGHSPQHPGQPQAFPCVSTSPCVI